MAPTLLPGDRLLVDTRAYRHEVPTVGDIAVVVDPSDPSRWLVKRVRAVGPREPSATRHGASAPDLPPGAVWVEGDAPGESRDSRQFGPILPQGLVGRVYRCYAPPTRARDL